MFKQLIYTFIAYIIYVNPATATQIVPLNEPFEIENNSSIFNTDLSYTYNEILKCNPKLDAVYKIEGIHKLKIIPKKALKSGTNYQCRYNGNKILFATEPFKLKDYHYFKRDKLLRLEFNDKIEAKSIQNHIHINKKDKLATTELKYTIIENRDNIVLLKINEPVYNSVIELNIDKEIKNINGGSLAKSFSANLNNKKRDTVTLNDKNEPMEIIDKPQMVALDNGEFAIRLFLSDILDDNYKDFIYIDGIENFKITTYKYISYEMRKKFGISDNNYDYYDIISPDFKPNSTYHLTLKKGLKSFDELKEDEHYTLKTGDRAKSIIFDGDKPYISSHGELGFSSININSATIIVQRVLDNNLRYFVNFENGDKDNVDKYLSEIFTKKIKLKNIKNKFIKNKFKLSELNGGNLPFGVYKITLRYSDKKEEKSKSKILFLSNIGISANISKTQALIHVMHLDSAEPFVTAMVYLYGVNNELIAKGKSDKYGMVFIEDSKLLSKKPKGIIVQTKHDTNFLAINSPILSPTFDDILSKSQRFRANIYPQSKIVRPNSKINALIIVKDRDFISAKKIPIKVIFREKDGKVIKEKIYHTDEYGLIDFGYQLDNEDKTGSYVITASIGDKEIGSTNIKVEAFMPPKIENRIQISKDSYYTGELIEANISSNYLFGLPASYLNGRIKFYTRPIDFINSRYKNYTFTNHELEESNTQTYIKYQDDIKLDRQGKISVAIPTIVKQKVPSILEGIVEATIMDDSQPVSSFKRIKLYPYKQMVGLKIDNKHFEKGQNLTGKAILIDPRSGKLLDGELYAVIKKVEWHYSYSDGNSHWEKETKVVSNFKIKSNKPFSIKSTENGNYIIEVSDRFGGHSASSSFDVWWQDYTNISPQDDLKSIEIEFDNKLYKKGDTLKAKFKSPILEGQLLILLEDDKIEGYKLATIEKGVAKVDLPILFDTKRGFYIHAIAYRATDRTSELIPFRAIGYKFVKADRTAHKIDIQIQSPNETKSKRAYRLYIKTDKKSEILVSVVDKGILQLVDQQTPKIFDFFNRQLDKQISYYDMYDELMSYLAKGKMISFGAGEQLDKKAKHLAPDLAKRIKPFMVWTGIIYPKDKDTIVSIDIPEFNGKASIVAIAINSDSIGVASKDIIIKDDIMIKPSYPKYLLKGDRVEVPIRIFNTTKKTKDINLTQKVSTNLSLSFDTKSLTLAPNSSKVIKAKLEAQKEGKGEITLIANFGKERVSSSIELAIYSPYAISTKTFKGITKKQEILKVPPKYQNAKAYITLSDNLIGVLRNDLKELISYPYGCAEQTTSKILAMYYAQPFLKNDDLIKKSKNFIHQGIKKLRNLQNYYGEFAYWESGGEINPYASLYSAQTLLELHNSGVAINQDIIDNSINMLKSVTTANRNYLGNYSDFHRVYAGYILAQNGKLSQSSVNMLYEKGFYKKHFLSTLYMASILKMQGRDKEADKLYKSVPYTLSSYQQKAYSNYSGNFESNIRDMFLHFIIKTKHFNKDSKDLAIIQKSFDNIYSTQEKAIALKALSIYLGKPKNSKIDVALNINGKTTIHTKPFYTLIDKVTSKSIKITPKLGALSYSIELVKHLPKAIKNRLSTTKKLSIQREFINEQGKKVNLEELKQGDTIYSKVTIANYGKINSVVINQRVPACLSIINSRIKNKIPNQKFQNININQKYIDIRDDRVLNFIDLAKTQEYNRHTKRYITKQTRGVIFTPLLVTTKGVCKIPAVIAESMYDSRVNDYAKGVKEIKVIDKFTKNKKI